VMGRLICFSLIKSPDTANDERGVCRPVSFAGPVD
jgi:hypothetical protein